MKAKSVQARVLIILLSAILGLSAVFAFAQEAGPGMGVTPSKIRLVVPLGVSVATEVNVINAAPIAMEVRLSSWDFALDEKGMPCPVDPKNIETFRRGCSDWVSFPSEAVKVGPNTTGPAELIVKPPGDAELGTYYCYVQFVGTPATSEEGTVGIAYRLNALLLVTVVPEGTGGIEEPGNFDFSSVPVLKRSAQLKSFSVKRINFTNPVSFTAKIENTGNVYLDLEGKIDLVKGKAVVESIPIKGRTLLPMCTATLNRAWEKPPLFGKFTAKFTGDAGLDKPFTSQKEFWVISQKLIFGGAGALLLFLALLVIFFKKFKIQLRSRVREGEEG